MADVGYFNSVSTNPLTCVDSPVKGISEGEKVNSDVCVSPSVNAFDTGLKSANFGKQRERSNRTPRALSTVYKRTDLPVHLQTTLPYNRSGYTPNEHPTGHKCANKKKRQS